MGEALASTAFRRGRNGQRARAARLRRGSCTVEDAIHRSLQRKKRFRPRTFAELIAGQIVIGATNGDQNLVRELEAYLLPPRPPEEAEQQAEQARAVDQIVATVGQLAHQRKELALHRMIGRDSPLVLLPEDKYGAMTVGKYALQSASIPLEIQIPLCRLEISVLRRRRVKPPKYTNKLRTA